MKWGNCQKKTMPKRVNANSNPFGAPLKTSSKFQIGTNVKLSNFQIGKNKVESKIESKIAGGLEKHAGLGLSPRMLPAVFGPSRLRVVGAVVETVDKAAAIGLTIQECGYFPMDSIHVLLFVSAARDAALIGDNYQSIAGVTESAESLWNAVEQLHVRRIAEIAIVGDESVVSV